jgi:hypothetical protein
MSIDIDWNSYKILRLKDFGRIKIKGFLVLCNVKFYAMTI